MSDAENHFQSQPYTVHCPGHAAVQCNCSHEHRQDRHYYCEPLGRALGLALVFSGFGPALASPQLRRVPAGQKPVALYHSHPTQHGCPAQGSLDESGHFKHAYHHRLGETTFVATIGSSGKAWESLGKPGKSWVTPGTLLGRSCDAPVTLL